MISSQLLRLQHQTQGVNTVDINEIKQSVEAEDASPEEEAEYEQAMEVAMTALNSGSVAKNTVSRVLNAENPAKGVAEAAFVILRKTEVELGSLSDAVKVQLGEDVIIEILGLMVDSERMQEGEVTDEMMEEIVTTLYTMYSQDAEQRGALDPETIRADLEGQGAKQAPQGANAMSNGEAQQRGLMNV